MIGELELELEVEITERNRHLGETKWLGDQRTGATDVSVSFFFFGREGVIWRGK